ncbi:DUF2227 family putative metal-binding protein [Methanococcoides sp. LMO-2]|uniref:DUF2227 family putative metal-binding protein n=1 Tax=Methanococcoides cohabitans TaxID=3136559 RepID=A0ABU9KUN0_9EURY
MPDAKTHDAINIGTMIAILAGLSYLVIWEKNSIAVRYLNSYTIALFSMSYLFGTFFLSPDLDIESTPYKRWGVLRFIWWPYKVIFKHRGISHNPILGPLSIVANLAVIVALLLLLAGVDLHTVPLRFAVVAIVGVMLSIEVHIISDFLVSKMKDPF